MNPDIYRCYTNINNTRVRENLKWLADHVDKETVMIRLPLIPEYNTSSDVAASRKELQAMGFAHFDEFEYCKI